MSYRLGLASQERMDAIRNKQNNVTAIKTFLTSIALEPEEAIFFRKRLIISVSSKTKASQLISMYQ